MPNENDWSEFIPPPKVVELTNRDEAPTEVELAGKWKHGYIPLDAAALASKMKGNTGGKRWWSGADPGTSKHRRRMLTAKDVPSAKAGKRPEKPSSTKPYPPGKISSMENGQLTPAESKERVDLHFQDQRGSEPLTPKQKARLKELTDRHYAANPKLKAAVDRENKVPRATQANKDQIRKHQAAARKMGLENLAPSFKDGKAPEDPGLKASKDAQERIAARAAAKKTAAPEISPREQKIRTRIESVYSRLPRSSDGWAGIVDLRRELPQVKPNELSAILKKLDREGKIALVPESNRKVLDEGDHNAAVRVGGEDNHLFRFH